MTTGTGERDELMRSISRLQDRVRDERKLRLSAQNDLASTMKRADKAEAELRQVRRSLQEEQDMTVQSCHLRCTDGLVNTGKLVAGASVHIPCPFCSDLSSIGRGTLLEMVDVLKRDAHVYSENLRSVHVRCTQLLEETRSLRKELAGLVPPGLSRASREAG